MNHIKLVFFLLFCAAVALVAVQNADILAPPMPVLIHWPGLLSTEFTLPLFVLIAIVFLAGFTLTGLTYLGEHLRLKRALGATAQDVANLERELHPEPEPERKTGPESEPDAMNDTVPNKVAGFESGSEEQPDSGSELRPDPDMSVQSRLSHDQQADRTDVDRAGRTRPDTVAAHIASPASFSQTLQVPTESIMEKTPPPEQKKSDSVEKKDLDVVAEENVPPSSNNLKQDPDGSRGPVDDDAVHSVQEPQTSTETPPETSAVPASGTLLGAISKKLSETVPETAPETVSGAASGAAPQTGDESYKTSESLQSATPSGNGGGFREDENMVSQSSPGWGAVLLLSAALALVVSSAVYIVLNDRVTAISEQLSDLHVQSGHMASTQDEMGRIWEQERVEVRDELEAMGQEHVQLRTTVESLEDQVRALEALPELFRKRLIAGFLWDAAGKTAFLGTQVETDEQRDALERVEDVLQTLARELEQDGQGH